MQEDARRSATHTRWPDFSRLYSRTWSARIVAEFVHPALGAYLRKGNSGSYGAVHADVGGHPIGNSLHNSNGAPGLARLPFLAVASSRHTPTVLTAADAGQYDEF